MKLVAVLFLSLVLSNSSHGNIIDGCSKDVDVYHAQARTVVRMAVAQILQGKHQPELAQALERYFRLDIRSRADEKKIDTVLRNVFKIFLSSNETRYYCRNSALCVGDQVALVPPLKLFLQLCPGFFTTLSFNERVGTIIHEWFHYWGGKKIDYYPENYCYEAADLAPSELIRQADQYMLFIHQLAGVRLDCF